MGLVLQPGPAQAGRVVGLLVAVTLVIVAHRMVGHGLGMATPFIIVGDLAISALACCAAALQGQKVFWWLAVVCMVCLGLTGLWPHRSATLFNAGVLVCSAMVAGEWVWRRATSTG